MLYEADAELVECPTNGDPAVVIGGWQEGRGGDIGVRYTDHRFNNSYFVENIKVLTSCPKIFLEPQNLTLSRCR